MSLINDALKKAQKLQMQGQAQPPPNPGGAPGAPGVSGAPNLPAGSGREKSMPGQIFMLLAFGAGVLIALSVLATVYLLRQPAAPVVAQAPAAPSPTSTAAPIAPEKPAFAPVIKNPALTLPQSVPPATVGEIIADAKLPTAPAPATAPAAPTASLFTPPPAPPALPFLHSFSEGGSQPVVSLSNSSNGLDPTKSDPKILSYLDAMKVAGVRVSDSGSKVLMNDRVFREGEIVDHLLGLRLKKVESDMLTFVDERGVIYTKSL
jgi:hypothetical protein